MIWTVSKPTQTGWYWWSFTSAPKRPQVVRVIRLDSLSICVAEKVGIFQATPVDDMPGEWLGPLEVPA